MSSLQSELSRLQPELIRISTETSMLMSKIEQETIEVENAREVVASDENRANAAATEAQTLKSESEQELADAIPALESAVDALQTMNQRDISTLKTMRFPPQGVRLCMEAVCILLGEAPARITDPLGGARVDYWVTGQKVLSDIHFLNRIRNFDKDNVSKETIAVIKK
uniref:MT domain-containing protein n=1 Tax=Ascaris lumbricoides TaxID=6252 RepID=A0A0M3ILM3_ASCLU